jgi:hypothetical protein
MKVSVSSYFRGMGSENGVKIAMKLSPDIEDTLDFQRFTREPLMPICL